MSRPLSGECYQALTRYLTIREKGKRLFIWSRIYEIDNPYESKANGSQKKGQRKKKPNATTAHLSRGYWYSL